MRIALAALFTRGLMVRHLLLIAAVPGAARAQTDYFNTDRGRPLHVQDAIAIERYAFELQAAPLRWSRSSGARVIWSVEPELAYGILPRTQLELGVPVLVAEGLEGGSRAGFGAVHISLLHALNTETLGIPALAVNAAVSIPAGDFGPQQTYATIGALVTRTTFLGRVHINGDATTGPGVVAEGVGGHPDEGELSRWTLGMAVDRAMPLRSILIGAEVVVAQPIREGSDTEWRAATGVRWQVNPSWAFDAGLGRSLGDEREWSLTFGAPRSMPYVMPMTPGVAPLFTSRYPEAAAIFDNLHSMHDVTSDVLLSEVVPRNRKRAEILLVAARYLDDTTELVSREDWLGMAQSMGAENQGGPVVGVLVAPPRPTVELGAVMRHDTGTTAAGHAGHRMPADTVARLADTLACAPDDVAARERLVNALFRLLEDPGVQLRVSNDSTLRRALVDLLPVIPEEHRDHYRMLLRAPPAEVPRLPGDPPQVFR